MIKIIKMTFVFLLAVMTASAILLLINEPKNIGSYAAIIVVTFFDIVAFFALFHKNNRLYQALNDPNLGEESEND